MDYEVKLALTAERALSALDPRFRTKIAARLIELGHYPSQLSRPVVSPPYPVSGMMMEFDLEPINKALHQFAVYFLYSQDETTIIVTAIEHTSLLIEDDEAGA